MNRITRLLEAERKSTVLSVESKGDYYRALCKAYVTEREPTMAHMMKMEVEDWLKREKLYTPELFRRLTLNRAEAFLESRKNE